MYKSVAAVFATLLFFYWTIPSFALGNAEPKEPKPRHNFNYTEDVDEPQPPDEQSFDNFEIKDPEFVEVQDPYEERYDNLDIEPAEPQEPFMDEPQNMGKYHEEPSEPTTEGNIIIPVKEPGK